MVLTGYFNPRTQGDTFRGLNRSIEGNVSDKVHSRILPFLEEAGRLYYVKRIPALPAGCSYPEGMSEQFMLVRSTDGVVVSPHTVTEEYDPLTLRDIGEELEPFCEQGWASPDGVFDRSGSLELLTLRLDCGGIMPDGEEMMHYLCILNPHGRGKAQGKVIDWRVVCGNTFAACVGASYDFSIGHRKASADPDGIAKERLALCVREWEHAREHVRKLADRIQVWDTSPLNVSEARNLTEKLLGIEGIDSEKLTTRQENKRDAIMAGFNNARIGTKGRTLWDWSNAVTYWTSNGEAGSKVSALDRLVRNVEPNGSGLKVEAEATRLALELVPA